MESKDLNKQVDRMIVLLEEIAKNTKPEKIKETKSKIQGFSIGEINGNHE